MCVSWDAKSIRHASSDPASDRRPDSLLLLEVSSNPNPTNVATTWFRVVQASSRNPSSSQVAVAWRRFEESRIALNWRPSRFLRFIINWVFFFFLFSFFCCDFFFFPSSSASGSIIFRLRRPSAPPQTEEELVPSARHSKSEGELGLVRFGNGTRTAETDQQRCVEAQHSELGFQDSSTHSSSSRLSRFFHLLLCQCVFPTASTFHHSVAKQRSGGRGICRHGRRCRTGEVQGEAYGAAPLLHAGGDGYVYLGVMWSFWDCHVLLGYFLFHLLVFISLS